MAQKSEEIIEKPIASRGRPRKDASASKTKKSSKRKTSKKSTSSRKTASKKRTSTTVSLKENVELIQDVQNLETSSSEPLLEEIIVEKLENEITPPIAEIENIEVNNVAEEILEVQENTSHIVAETTAINTEKKTKKRTIKNISIKRPSVSNEKTDAKIETPIIEEKVVEDIVLEEPVIEQPVVEEKIIELPKREKRTLRLNLGSNKKQEQIQEPVYKKDESINQNSSFFNEPSIFAKFNIDITNADTEDFIEEQNTLIEEPIIESTISEDVVLTEKENEILENNPLEETENINSLDTNIETIEQSILKDISETISEETIEKEIENYEILNSVRSILGGKLGSLNELEDNENKESSTSLSENSEQDISPENIEQELILDDLDENKIIENDLVEDNSDENQTIENDLVEDDLILEETIENELNDILENELVLNDVIETEIEKNGLNQPLEEQLDASPEIEYKEVADTISSTEYIKEKTSDSSPIGKFFDSSIPSMASTVNNTFSKIKKSLFSSSIFKKFTFDEATFRNHKEELENNYIEPENNLSDIQKALENFTPNVEATTNITEMDVQAEPVLSIPVIETNTLTDTKQPENAFDIPELNIITPVSDTSYDELEESEIDLETELFNDIIEDEIIKDLELEDVEKNEEIEDTINTNITEEEIIEPASIEEENDVVETTTIEDTENNDTTLSDNENNNIFEDEYNDEEFSIESYFKLDEIDFDNKSEKSIETTENEDISSIPETDENANNFIDKFFDENPLKVEDYEDNTIVEEEINSDNDTIEESSDTEFSSKGFVDKLLEANNVNTESVSTEKSDEKVLENEENPIEKALEKALKEKNQEISNLSKLLENFTQTISTLTDRIADLENKQLIVNETFEETDSEQISETNEITESTISPIEESDVEIYSEETNENFENIELEIEDLEEYIAENEIESSIPEEENINQDIKNENIEDEINIDDIDINDLDINDLDLMDLDIQETEIEEPSLLSPNESSDLEEEPSVESILSEVFKSKELDSELKEELLSEVLSYEETISDNENDFDKDLLEQALLDELSDTDLNLLEDSEQENQEALSDFSKIIDSLTKAITELEQTPDIKQEVEKQNIPTPRPVIIPQLPEELNANSNITEDKAINILINKDDIFSISILNETYEIVADFDGISVLSENLHISTPKNNFFVRVGNKYIEIHNKKDNFVLNTNFEDIEFANAINNIAFTKKNNKIELNIKEAFKLSSVNNKIELSMLNKAIADLTSAQSSEPKDGSSICDNKTLLISEETQKVYLPYTIEDVMKKLKSGEDYQTVQEVVDKEYTLPLSTFKMPIISRFKEAYRFMRVKENSSVYAAIDLALELMFNSNLNPAVIRAAKDLKELNIYLDCLYENEVEKFDCFKIIYKVLPKIK